MWTPHTPIPVEAAFDLFVNAAGGQRVSSLLTGSPSFENADYAFPTVDVIGELKEIETDFAEDARFRSKHEELLHRSVSEGRISVPIILGADRASGDFVEDFVASSVQRFPELSRRRIVRSGARNSISDGVVRQAYSSWSTTASCHLSLTSSKPWCRTS